MIRNLLLIFLVSLAIWNCRYTSNSKAQNTGVSENIILIALKERTDLEFDNFNFLNIDVQGYELEVLKGGAKTLEGIDYIYTEINRAEVYENTPHVDELDSYLKPYGFIRVESDWTGDTWGDGLYIKEKSNV